MNHYCTYFDSNFLPQGLALWRSLARFDTDAQLWVLALDKLCVSVLSKISDQRLCAIDLADFERIDSEAAATRSTRSRAEYYFTLSPCWPRWLLACHPEIERLTYIDADMFFFGSPTAIFASMDRAMASVLVTSHRFPSWLEHYYRHGTFNVGIICFRNDSIARKCLDRWRSQCLDWCYDRLERGKYADQKYLDDWPSVLGSALCVLDHPGVNSAPWNWVRHRWSLAPDKGIRIDNEALVLFHFARFRRLCGDWWWQSGQLDYGIMPWRLRNALYGAYWRALAAARREIAHYHKQEVVSRKPLRLGRGFLLSICLRGVFGSDWLRVGPYFVSGRFGLGRYSGRCLAQLRRIFLRR